MNPLLLADFYKVSHYAQYPKGTEFVYSNFTARKSRINGIDEIVFFGLQYFVKEYLIEQFNKDFFKKPKKKAIAEYKRILDYSLGKDSVDTKHIEELHDLGYLPLEIRALPEGSKVPIRVPMLTMINTLPQFYWLTNYVESIMSAILWQPITSATISNRYREILDRWASKTSTQEDFVNWQGHDFSFRGMGGLESAMMSGAGHLLNFTGTDTIPALVFLEKYYNANVEKELIGGSVPATEHSVMCAGGSDGEFETFQRLINEIYPSGIVSIVSDTWNLWTVLTDFLPRMRDEILARDGKVVIRPDSGDPVDIICGGIHRSEGNVEIPSKFNLGKGLGYDSSNSDFVNNPEFKGVIELLWDTFGGTINSKGYRELDPHIGALYGDSITLERAEEICKRLEAKGFASTNIVFGIGSYTYQYNTRDTFGMAMKATWVRVNGEGREIFKDPVTDNGTKKSAKGLLRVYLEDGKYKLQDQVSFMDSTHNSELELIFLNGKIMKEQKLSEIRKRVKE